MKQGNQNEIDVLLRSLARRNDGVVSSPLNSSEHLDADELNAFAEGIVTERARARYSAHLAECANCRGIVVNLTQSAGFAAPRMATEVTLSKSFWQQLSGFFSYPVLRFVVPAIVLVSVIGIGVIALRQDEPGDFVAQHEPTQQPNLDEANAVAASQSPLQTNSNAPDVPTTPPVADASSADARRDKSAGAGAGTSEGPATLQKQADAPLSQATPAFAPEVSAPAAPPPTTVYAERDRGQPLARQEAAKREVEAGQPGEARPLASESVDRNKTTTATAGAAENQPKQRNVQGLLRESRANKNKDNNKTDTSERADTRTVSGKRFIRQNNSWIDAAYQQSRATTNVKRGSEQYRALIADEPGLRAFAEQLGGEVIVVWNGRAYRFY